MSTRTFRKPALLLASTLLAFGAAIAGASTASAVPVTNSFVVNSVTAGEGGNYLDTGIVLPAAGTITLTTSGMATFDSTMPQLTTDAVGYPSTCDNTCLVSGVNFGALVVKIGDAAPVAPGVGPTTLTGTGKVLLAYNDTQGSYANNSGAFTVSASYDDGTTPQPTPTPKPCINLGSSCVVLPFGL